MGGGTLPIPWRERREMRNSADCFEPQVLAIGSVTIKYAWHPLRRWPLRRPFPFFRCGLVAVRNAKLSS